MTNDRLPRRRAQRRVVFVLDQAGIDALNADPTAHEVLAREDAAVLNAGTDPSLTDDIAKGLERQGLLVPGSILIASPYRDGDYASLDEAVDRFSLEKWSAVSTLCSLLGAQTLSVQVVEDTVTNTRVEVQARGGRGPVDAGATGSMSHVERFVGQMHWDDVFVGGEMALDRATDYLKASGLESDPEVRSLVEARSHPGNLLVRRTVTIDLSRESQRTIDAALKIRVPAILNLDGTFQRAAESQAHYKVTLEVVFADG